MRVKVLVFDLGGVLVRLRPLNVFMGFLEEHSRFRSGESAKFEAMTNRVLDGRWSVRDLYDRLCAAYGLESGWSEFLEAFNSLWIGGEMGSVIAMLPLLRRRYRLWMLSNTNAAHVEYIRRTTRVFRLFERTFFSHKLKMIKPSSRLFSLVNSELKRSGFKPSEVLFLDDAVENRRAARKAGWRVLAAVTNRPVGPLLERALGA